MGEDRERGERHGTGGTGAWSVMGSRADGGLARRVIGVVPPTGHGETRPPQASYRRVTGQRRGAAHHTVGRIDQPFHR